jgi:hypothetical protein
MLVSISLSSNMIRERGIFVTEAIHGPAFLLFQSSFARDFRDCATSIVKSTLWSYRCNATMHLVINVPVPLTPTGVVLRRRHQRLTKATPCRQLVPQILPPKQRRLGTSRGV